MKNFSVTVDINAPVDYVWDVMTDIDHWHEWTDSISSIRRLNGGPFAVGTFVLIKQPKFPPALWRISEIVTGKTFSWSTSGPAMHAVATHSVEPALTGTRATLTLDFNGFVGGLFARMTSGNTERYIAMEAAGLKRRSESAVRTLSR